jgi:hypothetical protein
VRTRTGLKGCGAAIGRPMEITKRRARGVSGGGREAPLAVEGLGPLGTAGSEAASRRAIRLVMIRPIWGNSCPVNTKRNK